MKNNIFVFDTNTLLSAMFDERSIPATALVKARANGILVVSQEVAAEYIATFSKGKFDRYVPQSIRFAFIENIISNAVLVNVESSIKVCRDPKDDKFLSLAAAAGASCIVSGDNDLLVLNPFREISILKPNDFVNLF